MSSFDSKSLPESFRRRMAPEARKELHVPTNEEAQAKAARGEELKMHADFDNWCRQAGIVVVHSRTDRKSTIAAGHPDFTLLRGGRGCCVEFKATGGLLDPDQIGKLRELDEAKVPNLVAYDLASAIKFAIVSLGIPTGTAWTRSSIPPG